MGGIKIKYKYINYIVHEFSKQYPTISTEKLESILSKASEDELNRVTDSIQRFGVEAIGKLVKNNV